jgi:hypothetical protein
VTVRAVMCLVVTTLATTAATPAPGVFRYAWPVEVATPGWVRVRLEPATVGMAGSTGGDLWVLDPAGNAVPFLRTRGDTVPPVVARITAATERAEGWMLDIDLGASPPRHQGTGLDIADHTTVPGARLEGSADGTAWHLLAEGDLFRLGEGFGLERTDLAYAPTGDRYLRLAWPRAAGLPTVETVRVQVVPPAPVAPVAFPVTVEPPADGDGRYLLRLPGPGLPLLNVQFDLEGAPEAGFLLSQSAGDDEMILAQGTLARGEDGSWPPVQVSGAQLLPNLRLELFGEGGATPTLSRATAALLPEWAVFQATTPGTYHLAAWAIDRDIQSPPVLGVAPPTFQDIAEVASGPYAENPVPTAPASVTLPGVAVDVGDFARVWPVTAEGAFSGDVVHLTVPDATYAVTSGDLGDVRLVAGGRQVPYLHFSPGERVLAAHTGPLVPVAAVSGGRSYVTVTVPAARIPLADLEIRAAAAPFARLVTVAYRDPTAPVPGYRDDPVGIWIATSDWSCRGPALIPCRLRVPLAPLPTDTILVTLDDGDNPPLPEVDVRVWRTVDTMAFSWPPGGAVQLAVGNPALTAPAYDLALAETDLVTGPFVTAAVDTRPPGEGQETGADRLDRLARQWGLAAAVALAAVVLLALLARTLRSAEEGT